MPGSGLPFALSAIGFVLLATLLMMVRVALARRQMALDELYLDYEES